MARKKLITSPIEEIKPEIKPGRKPGTTKTGGRVAGTPNKRTFDARALAERLGVDPLEILLHVASNNHEAMGYKVAFVTKVNMGIEYEEALITMDHRLQAAKDAAKYLYPQLKSVELTGKDGNDLFTQRLSEARNRILSMGSLVGDAKVEDELEEESEESEGEEC